MKKLVLVLTTLLPLFLFAQQYQKEALYGKQVNRINPLISLNIPRDTFQLDETQRGYPAIAGSYTGDTLYTWNVPEQRWKLLKTGNNNGGVVEVNNGDSIVLLFYVDSSFYITKNADSTTSTLHLSDYTNNVIHNAALQQWVIDNFAYKADIVDNNYWTKDLTQIAGSRHHNANGNSLYVINGDSLVQNYNHYFFKGAATADAADSIYGKSSNGEFVLIPYTGSGGGTQVNADWTVTDPESPAYILNKPEGLTTPGIDAVLNVGATAYDKSILINNSDGSGYIFIEPDDFELGGAAGTVSINADNLTNNRHVQFQDKNGTLAYTNDNVSQFPNDAGYITNSTQAPSLLLEDGVPGPLVISQPLMLIAITDTTGNAVSAFPLNVYNVAGVYLGHASTAAQYITLWNADAGNTAQGTIVAQQSGMYFTVTPKYVNIIINLYGQP